MHMGYMLQSFADYGISIIVLFLAIVACAGSDFLSQSYPALSTASTSAVEGSVQRLLLQRQCNCDWEYP